MIGERGITLSGGQRQRVAIARALVVDPRILILDDATASVDATTEAKIRDGLREAMRGRTTIIIAHRLSTIALADEVIVLDDGRVAARGTHDELVDTNDVYREIYEHGLLERVLSEEVAIEDSMRVHQPGSHLMRGGRPQVDDWSWAQTRRRLRALYRLARPYKGRTASRSSRCSARRPSRSRRRTSSAARSTRCSHGKTGAARLARAAPSSRAGRARDRVQLRADVSTPAGRASACSPTCATTSSATCSGSRSASTSATAPA